MKKRYHQLQQENETTGEARQKQKEKKNAKENQSSESSKAYDARCCTKINIKVEYSPYFYHSL